MIDARHYRKIDEIFQAALELPPDERPSFISQACAGDESLLREVEYLLASDERDWELINKPAFEMVAPLLAKNQQELSEGARLGHYNIFSLLGTGGMGQVYLAEDTRLGRKVALKLLPGSYTRDESRLRRFQQEARAASALNHPNILTIHDIWEIEGRHIIATEYVEGESLRQRLRRSKLTTEEVLNVSIQVASALSAAHQAGIVHRDIKPENIMLRPDGYVKVLDFGLAKLIKQAAVSGDTEASTIGKIATRTGLIMGTVNYMSPEQARGVDVDARSDIFSLGIVVYEMVAGRTPFEGKTPSEIIASILKVEPPPLANYSSEIPEQLQSILTKALRKEKEERYQTIQDLLTHLRDLRQELELKSILYHSAQPGASREASSTSSAQTAAQTKESLTLSTGDATAAPTTSSVGSSIRIKRHKVSAILIFTVLTVFVLSMTFGLDNLVGKLRAPFQKWMSGAPGDGKETISSRFDTLLILPFEAVGKPPGEDYLGHGMADSLTSSLSNIKGLKVRPVVAGVKHGYGSDLLSAGRAAGVAAVLHGQIREVGDRIRVTVRLVGVEGGETLWRETLDAASSEVSSLLHQIVERVTSALLLPLSEKEKVRLGKPGTESADAYRAYVRGRYYWNKRTVEDFKRAIEEFNRAIELDPSYGEAYTGLADSYNLLNMFGGMPAAESAPKAKAAARRALELDDALAEAHTSLAAIRDWYEFDKEGAEEAYRRAIELKYNYPTAHHWYALYLMMRKRYDEAIREILVAAELDPLSTIIGTDVGVVYSHAERYEEAVEQFRKVLASDPDFVDAHVGLGRAYQFMGKYQDAIAAHKRAIELSGSVTLLADLGWLYAASGAKEEARKILEQMRKVSAKRYVPRESLILIYSALDMKDEAFEALERLFRDGSGHLANMMLDARLENLRSDPRYMNLVRRIGVKS